MIKLIKSTFFREEEIKKKLVAFISSANILSMGEECKKFEESFAKKQKRKYAVFVSSGSAANLVLFQSLLNLGFLKRGDRIGVSALTWATNVMPVIQMGLLPEIIDVSLETLNVSPEILKNSKRKIKAFFVTNALGFADDLIKIKDYCAKEKIILLEDNCESLGSKIGKTLLGNFGLASTFSFYVGHHLSTIEGGMVCTDNRSLYEMMVTVRAHGWDRNLPVKTQKRLRQENKIGDFEAKYTFYDLAYNVRPTEIQGLAGDLQVGYWDEIVKTREENYRRIDRVAKQNKYLVQQDFSHMSIISNFAFPLIFREQRDYEKSKKRFIGAGVEIRPVIAGNIARQPFYAKYVSERFKGENADKIHSHGFYFGNNPELSEEEIKLLEKLIAQR